MTQYQIMFLVFFLLNSCCSYATETFPEVASIESDVKNLRSPSVDKLITNVPKLHQNLNLNPLTKMYKAVENKFYNIGKNIPGIDMSDKRSLIEQNLFSFITAVPWLLGNLQFNTPELLVALFISYMVVRATKTSFLNPIILSDEPESLIPPIGFLGLHNVAVIDALIVNCLTVIGGNSAIVSLALFSALLYTNTHNIAHFALILGYFYSIMDYTTRYLVFGGLFGYLTYVSSTNLKFVEPSKNSLLGKIKDSVPRSKFASVVAPILLWLSGQYYFQNINLTEGFMSIDSNNPLHVYSQYILGGLVATHIIKLAAKMRAKKEPDVLTDETKDVDAENLEKIENVEKVELPEKAEKPKMGIVALKLKSSKI